MACFTSKPVMWLSHMNILSTPCYPSFAVFFLNIHLIFLPVSQFHATGAFISVFALHARFPSFILIFGHLRRWKCRSALSSWSIFLLAENSKINNQPNSTGISSISIPGHYARRVYRTQEISNYRITSLISNTCWQLLPCMKLADFCHNICELMNRGAHFTRNHYEYIYISSV